MTDKDNEKSVFLSTTQIALTLGSIITVVNIILRYRGASEIQISNEEMLVIAGLISPIIFNIYAQYRRCKPQKKLYLRRRKDG